MRMKRRLVLFTPVLAALLLANLIAISQGIINKSWPMMGAAGLLLGVSVFVTVQVLLANRSVRRVNQELERTLSPYQSQALQELAVPVAAARATGELLWYNEAMRERVFAGEDHLGQNLGEIFPELSLTAECPPQGFGVSWKGKQFSAFPAPGGSEEEKLTLLYLFDDDKLKRIAKEYFASRPVAAVIMIDNYEELLQNARENEKSQIMGEIEYQIESYVNSYEGLIKKLDKDKFFVVFEERYIRAVVENRFTILDTVRRISASDKLPATLSIGVGRDAQNLAVAEQYANQALDMALGRGGDQAAVKNKNGYEFYGGLSKGVEKRTKVKTRIVAAALTELIGSSSNVLIMGHRFADLDALGSAAGLYHPISAMGKPVKIVMDREKNLVREMREKLERHYPDAFVEPQNALEYIQEETLLIVVDVHTPHMTEAPEVYSRCKNVVVIDHHRKMVNYIDNAVIFHHEPYASSASEMVAELIQYFGDQYKPSSVVAEAMMCGMMLDTKNFIMRTGVRTFEAAAYLRRMGADTVEAKKMFATSIQSYQQKCIVVSAAQVYRSCAISAVSEPVKDIKIVAAQAADDLLGISDVDASFVLYYESETVVSYSARSMGKINVQVIMEKLGGGGHMTMAGCQIKNIDLERAKALLVEAIDRYYEEQETQ